MRATPLTTPLTLLLALACVAAPLHAKKIWKVVDADGITHYTDRKPADVAAEQAVHEIAVRAEREPIALLRLEGLSEERRAVVSNRLAGAIEVEVTFSAHANIAASPQLPLRTVIPAESERVVATMRSADTRLPASFALALEAVPGTPDARADATPYLLPLDTGAWRIDQGFGGRFSHTDAQSRYAIDLAADVGTPVLAAREGIVMQVEDDFEGAGLNREKYGGRANHVRVLHADGTMAVYAHLKPESVVVAPGARVRLGQRIGASGNTGFSSGPHLHFALQVNRGMELVSIPFELQGPGGPIEIPVERD